MKFTLGFSPCPNDTFIFDALVNKKIDTEGLEFEPVLEDVQTLNNWCLEEKLDVSKISYGVLPLVTQSYALLESGGALGKGVGPLLISRNNIDGLTDKITDLTIAIPGRNTTAHLLFSYCFPNAEKKEFLVFNEIENAVLTGKVDAGVIIHENRFTYADKGLVKLVDLGEYWEEQTKAPIPLGGIVIKRTIDAAIQCKIDSLIQRSLEYAFKNYPFITDYVKQHSQEMDESVMRKHIDLYVNDYSLALGKEGKAAVENFLNVYSLIHNTTVNAANVFVPTEQ